MNVMSKYPITSPQAGNLTLFYTPVPVAQGIVCQFDNTSKILPDAGTGAYVPNAIISCQPDGSLEARPPQANGAYEVAVIDGAGSLTFWPGQAKLGPTYNWYIVYKFLGSTNIPVL